LPTLLFLGGVLGWAAGANGTGAHSNPGFKQQTKKKLNLGEPPEKKSISDLP
jgi:hypothetical protein